MTAVVRGHPPGRGAPRTEPNSWLPIAVVLARRGRVPGSPTPISTAIASNSSFWCAINAWWRSPGTDDGFHRGLFAGPDRLSRHRRLYLGAPLDAADRQGPDAPAGTAGVARHVRQQRLASPGSHSSSPASSAGLGAALVAVLVGSPLMRLSGNYVAVATMGFLIIVHSIAVNWDGGHPRRSRAQSDPDHDERGSAYTGRRSPSTSPGASVIRRMGGR